MSTTLATDNELSTWATANGVTLPSAGHAEALERATAEVQTYCGRAFVMSPSDGGADEARTFNGNGEPELGIDDLLEITSVTISDDAVDSTGYKLHGAGTLPYTSIERSTTTTFETQVGGYTVPANYVWTEGSANIEITGLWGYASTVPAPVVEACCMLAALRLLGGSGWGQLGISATDVLNVSIKFDGGARTSALRKAALEQCRAYRRAEPEPNLSV